MEVLLVNPPKYERYVQREEDCAGGRPTLPIPAQLVLATSFLRSKGIHANIMDLQGSRLGYAAFHPDGFDVVVSSVSVYHSFYHDIEALKIAKQAGATTVMILNDPFDGLEREALETYDFIDFAVRLNEREETLHRLIQHLDGERSPPSGIIFRHKKEIIDTGKSPYLNNAEHLVSSDNVLEELPLSNYGKAVALSGKGCPFRCTFCFYRRTRHRSRRPDAVVNEVELLSTVFNHVYVLDLDILLNKRWVIRFAEELKRRQIDVTWHTDARLDQCDRETLKELKDSGLSGLFLGVEAAEPEILQRIQKDIDLEIVRKGVANCQEAGVIPHLSFMFGFPWDSKATAKKIVAVFKELRQPCAKSIWIIHPARGTPIYGDFKRLNLITEDLTIKDYCQIHDTNIFGKPLAPTLHLTQEEVERISKKIDYQMFRTRYPTRERFLECLMHTPHLLPIKASKSLKDYFKARL